MNKIGKILSIDFKPKLHKIPKAIQVLVKQRNLARRKGEWKLSDKIRVELRDKGYLLQDTEGDTQVSVR